jgi:type VI protein secretion system component Hcp
MSVGVTPTSPPYFQYFLLKKPMDASSSKLQLAMMNLEVLDRVVVTVQTVATIGSM